MLAVGVLGQPFVVIDRTVVEPEPLTVSEYVVDAPVRSQVVDWAAVVLTRQKMETAENGICSRTSGV